MKRKRLIIIASILVVIAAIAVYILFANKNKSPFETVTVRRSNISEEVSVTGNVKPVQSVDLASEKSGRIVTVNADVGDKVFAGETLVSLDKTELTTQLDKAEANLATQKADLDKARVDLANYYGDVINILNDAYTKADDAVRIKTSSLFSGSQTGSYQLILNSCDSQAMIDATALKLQSDVELTDWQNELAALTTNSSTSTTLMALQNAEKHLNLFKRFLERTNANLITSCIISNSNYDNARTNVITARTNINTALTNITNQEQSIAAQEATIASLSADIGSYKADALNIKAQISKMTIYAPISGIVTVQNAKVGEIAPANGIMVSIISANKFEVEANVAEADIAKVKIGNPAAITLDTYGNDVIFDAQVSSIDPAETMIEGVTTYKTKLQFLQKDERLKSGMTANITIFTNKRENVLVIPQRTVTTANGEQSVLIDLGNGKSEKRKITTGLKGADGNVEVINGLNKGDKVIINSA